MTEEHEPEQAPWTALHAKQSAPGSHRRDEAGGLSSLRLPSQGSVCPFHPDEPVDHKRVIAFLAKKFKLPIDGGCAE
jgi:hypothetical protein